MACTKQIKQKCFLSFIYFVIFVAILPASVFAAGIWPSLVSINFEKGLRTSLTFNIEGYPGDFWIENQCPEYFTINESTIERAGDRARFNVDVHLPDKIDRKPGTHRCIFFVHHGTNSPAIPKGQGIAAITEVGGVIEFNIPAEGRYAEIRVNAPNVNKGEPLFVKVEVDNMGTIVLNDISAKVEILDAENKTIETGQTTSAVAPLFSTIELWKRFETKKYDSARYTARAILDYGGKEPAYAQTSFLIGSLTVKFLGIEVKGYSGRIIPVSVSFESWWGNPIENVYAEVRMINSSGAEAGTFKTVSTDLQPWQKATVEGYWDTTFLAPGEYDAEITLNYKGGKTEAKAKVVLQEEPKPVEVSTMSIAFEKIKTVLTPSIVVVLIILLIIVNIGIIVYRKKFKH